MSEFITEIITIFPFIRLYFYVHNTVRNTCQDITKPVHPNRPLQKKMKFHIGCSSYYNSKWVGIFYPETLPRKQWFEFYCQHFNTYELNATFYRFPTLKVLETWYNKCPPGFLLSVKAPKVITHLKKFADCHEEVAKFYDHCRNGLKEKLASLLFQLPPSFSYSPERLDLIVSHLDPAFSNVVEFRNESWWRQDVISRLAESGIVFASVDYPKLPATAVKTADQMYVRMHGNPKLFYSQYSKQELAGLFDKVAENKPDDCFIYFNNTIGEAGILNALAMKNIVAKIT